MWYYKSSKCQLHEGSATRHFHYCRQTKIVKENDLYSLNNLSGLNDLDGLISSKTLLILMVWSSLAPKWPLPVPFCGIDCQKSNFSLISDTLSVGGCWGQPMSFFWKLVDETQISAPPEATRHHKSKKILVLLSLRANLKSQFRNEIPCNTVVQKHPPLSISKKIEQFFVC